MSGSTTGRDYEACSFVKVLFEVGAEGRIGKACIGHLDKIRDVLRERAEEAGLRNANDLAWSLNILVKGSIVCAAEGDLDSARRAKPVAAWLIKEHTLNKPTKGAKKARHEQRLIMRIAISGAGVAGAALAYWLHAHRP